MRFYVHLALSLPYTATPSSTSLSSDGRKYTFGSDICCPGRRRLRRFSSNALPFYQVLHQAGGSVIDMIHSAGATSAS